MTNEEAIRIFQIWIERDSKLEYCDREENIELYKMAIKALGQTNTAEWIDNIDTVGETHELRHLYRCSKCEMYFSEQTNFCPNCGSRMKGENQ